MAEHLRDAAEGRVLTAMEDEAPYQPKTNETRAVYEHMLSIIQEQLGGQPLSIAIGASVDILKVLNNVSFDNFQKKFAVEHMFNPKPNNDVVDQLVSIGCQITDYTIQDEGDAGGPAMANVGDVGVVVDLEENEDVKEECYCDTEENDDDTSCEWFQRKPHLLDLDKLAQEQSRLLVSNTRVALPDGSYRLPEMARIGFEEIHVPKLEPRPFDPTEKLVEVSSMPEWAQLAFTGMPQLTKLNRAQSRAYETALFKQDNILLCAPTGAGKTIVALLTILQQIQQNMNKEDGLITHSNYMIVYVVPMEALVTHVVDHLSKHLERYGVTVKMLSGDQSFEESQIIVTTPEEWDITTRKSENGTYTQLVKLLIIDEIHLLHGNRGPVLENIVARTVRQSVTTNNHIRLVGLSAPLPNYGDVADFLDVDHHKGLFYFDNSYRHVPLSQEHFGILETKPWWRFRMMNELCKSAMGVLGKRQVLIFVHSMKETVKTARSFRDTALADGMVDRFLEEDGQRRDVLASHAVLLGSDDLKDLLPCGFAFHHADLSQADRYIVENLFANGCLQVLVSTAALAWGANLRADTVVIKGTQIYDPEKGAWTELSPLNVMQMLGCAGRPGHDGKGIIITGYNEVPYYLSLMNQHLPIESQFVSKLADQLNAEIVLGTVQNAIEACNWLRGTYLHARMSSNPTLHGLKGDDLETEITCRLADLIHSAATVLDKNNLVKYDRKSGYLQVTDLGRIASYCYTTHLTVSTFNDHLKRTMTDIELFQLLPLSEEFKYVNVRQDEKMELLKLLDLVPTSVKESLEDLEDPSAKINVLLHAYISRLKLEGLSLTSDMVYISQTGGRLLRVLFMIVLKRGWAQLAAMVLNLSKMVNRRMRPEQTQLQPYMENLPKLKVAASVEVEWITTSTILSVELTITQDFQWKKEVHGYVEPFWIMVEDNGGEFILHHENFLLQQKIGEVDTLKFAVRIHETPPPHWLMIRAVSDRWLGAETVIRVSAWDGGKYTG